MRRKIPQKASEKPGSDPVPCSARGGDRLRRGMAEHHQKGWNCASSASRLSGHRASGSDHKWARRLTDWAKSCSLLLEDRAVPDSVLDTRHTTVKRTETFSALTVFHFSKINI